MDIYGQNDHQRQHATTKEEHFNVIGIVSLYLNDIHMITFTILVATHPREIIRLQSSRGFITKFGIILTETRVENN